MRLWSLDPRLLDRAALVAAWREGLLAQAVLLGRTRGYRHHPQLERFRALPDPEVGIATWLSGVADAATERGYRFDRTRIATPAGSVRLEVTDGQLRFEWRHLRSKVEARDPGWLPRLDGDPVPHPMVDIVPGDVEGWERAI